MSDVNVGNARDWEGEELGAPKIWLTLFVLPRRFRAVASTRFDAACLKILDDNGGQSGATRRERLKTGADYSKREITS